MPRIPSRDNEAASSSANVRSVRDHEIPRDPPKKSPILGVIAVLWGLLAGCVALVIIDHWMTSAESSRTEAFCGAWMLLSALCLCVGGACVATGRDMRWLVLMGVISQAVPITLLLLR